MDQTALDYTTCASCGSERTLRQWGKRLRCTVCRKTSQPAPSQEQIKEAKEALRKQAEGK